MDKGKKNNNHSRQSKHDSALAQIWKSTLDFVSELTRSVDTGNIFNNAILKFAIIFMVLLTCIIIFVLLATAIGPQEKANLIWLLVLLLAGVFFVMLVVTLVRTPRDINLANGQNARAREINPSPIA